MQLPCPESCSERAKLVCELQAAVKAGMVHMQADLGAIKNRMKQISQLKHPFQLGLNKSNGNSQVASSCGTPRPVVRGACCQAALPHQAPIFLQCSHQQDIDARDCPHNASNWHPTAQHPFTYLHPNQHKPPQQVAGYPLHLQQQQSETQLCQQASIAPLAFARSDPARSLSSSPYPAIERMLLRKHCVLGFTQTHRRQTRATGPAMPDAEQVQLAEHGSVQQMLGQWKHLQQVNTQQTNKEQVHDAEALLYRLQQQPGVPSKMQQDLGSAMACMLSRLDPVQLPVFRTPSLNVPTLKPAAQAVYAGLRTWREQRVAAATRVQAAVRGHLCRLQLAEAAQAASASAVLASSKLQRCLHAWFSQTAVRLRLRSRMYGWRYKRFNGRQILREEGKYGYAAAWCTYRRLEKGWQVLLMSALRCTTKDAKQEDKKWKKA